MSGRPKIGRGLLYTRDSMGKSDLAPPQYADWAGKEAKRLGVQFSGTPRQMEAMIARGAYAEGDLFLDYGVSGNVMDRPGLNAFMELAKSTPDVTHLFIPRRDRLARPHNPVEGLMLEVELREAGLTIIMLDAPPLAPLPPGKRIDLSELLTSLLGYESSGKFRLELAQKLILAKIKLAESGRSIGGQPPYGFRRWLCGPDGSRKRELERGDTGTSVGCHVIWLPTATEELAVVGRILELIETTPASRIAAIFNDEDIPSPYAGRTRRRGGKEVAISGLWAARTILNIASNKLLIGVCEYGRRAEGDQMRMTKDGPRLLGEADFNDAKRPKRVFHADGCEISVPAAFTPVVSQEQHDRVQAVLAQRSSTQRGKPRARQGNANPLGCRVVDLNCGWPMYRKARDGAYGYACGLYQNSEGRCCQHNQVPGEKATRVVLESLRQRLFTPTAMAKLEAKVMQLARAKYSDDSPLQRLEAARANLGLVQGKLDKVGRNLAFANTKDEHDAVAKVLAELKAEEARGLQEIRRLESQAEGRSPESAAAAAMSMLERLGDLANGSPASVEAVTELFRRLNARLYINFQQVPRGRKVFSVPAGGVIAFGSTPPPAPLYNGPTDRNHIRHRLSRGEAVCARPVRGAPAPPDGGSSDEPSGSANVESVWSRRAAVATELGPLYGRPKLH